MEDIVKRIQNGEEHLLDSFIKDNIRYVYDQTKKYYGIFEDYDDLVQEALIAFVRSIYSFDTNKKYFLPYLNIKIYSTVNKYVYSNLDRILNKLKRNEIALELYKKCENRVEFEPDVDALVNYYGLYISDAQQLFNICKCENIYFNLEDFKDYYQDYSLETVLDNVESDLFLEKLNSVKMLTDNEREYIMLKYVNGIQNDIDIARRLGVSKQLICNRSKHLNKKLRLLLKNKDN